MFWSIKYIHNREYKRYWQNEKTAKLWILSIFLTKEGLNKYIKLLCEMKLWDKLRFYKKGVLRNFITFAWTHLCWNFFFNKVTSLRPETLLKWDSDIGVFWWILWDFLRTPFLLKPTCGCFFIKASFLSIFCNEKSFKQIFSNLLV